MTASLDKLLRAPPFQKFLITFHCGRATTHNSKFTLPSHVSAKTQEGLGHPRLLLQSLLRVSVRPTTSFYRGFQCDPQLPFISLFFQLLAPANHSVIITISLQITQSSLRSACKSYNQSLRSTCKSQALWHIEAASTSLVSQALALNSDIS